jgi:hypothetical protein
MWLIIRVFPLSERCNCRIPQFKTDSSIPECPAFEICKSKGRGCEGCLNISVKAWRRNVAAICKKRRKDG